MAYSGLCIAPFIQCYGTVITVASKLNLILLILLDNCLNLSADILWVLTANSVEAVGRESKTKRLLCRQLMLNL